MGKIENISNTNVRRLEKILLTLNVFKLLYLTNILVFQIQFFHATGIKNTCKKNFVKLLFYFFLVPTYIQCLSCYNL